MNILMVHPHDLYSNLEPWTNRIKYIAKEFVNRGHRVKLVYFPLWNRPWQDGEPECGEDYEEIAFERKKTAIFQNIRRMTKLAAWCDIVHFQKCFSHACLPSLFAAWLNRKPVHYDWDDWEMQIYNYDSPSRVVGLYLDIMERVLPVMADTVSGASRRLRKLCLEGGVDSERIFDSHVGADLEQFNPAVDGSTIRKRYNIKSPLVLYLGQLHGAQYAEMFIKSARLILDKGVNADFMIVGDGSRFFEFKNLIEELRLGDKIILTGAISHRDIPQYIAACDVAVACFEDNDITRCKSPLKIAEYLASGKAVVASEVGDVPQMIAGCGLLVAPGDIDYFSEAIIRLLRDSKLRQELGQKARERAEEKYNWAVTADNLLSAYRLALGRYKT
jgi:glycosyltransferase involved in cell wall biosynthesis